MADKTITELDNLVNLSNDDVFVCVDISEETTKKVTYGNLMNNVTGSLPPGLGGSGLGWARYDDTQYTTSSVFNVLTSDGDVTLPNNAGNTIETHLHSSISFYNSGSQKIQVENDGDVYMMTVVFKAKTANANGTSMRLQMDSTGETPYERVGKDLFFGKGNDVWHDFHEVFQYYGDADFVTNGNRLKIRAVGNSVSIANIIVFIQRTQNHGH
jgi:hypothetical protein